MEITEAELAEQTAIVRNAVRLIKDAKLLMDHERHANAFALAVIALEEFGKVILRCWEADKSRPPPRKRRTSHLAKQEAVSCLLLAHFVATELGDMINNHEGDDDALSEKVARAMYESEAGRFSQEVTSQVVEKTKHLALYRDQDPTFEKFRPEHFTGTDPKEMFDMCRTVTNAIWDARMMRVGRAMYDNASKYEISSKKPSD